MDTSSIKYALQSMRPSNRLRKGDELKVIPWDKTFVHLPSSLYKRLSINYVMEYPHNYTTLQVVVTRPANRQSPDHLVWDRLQHHLHPQSPPMLSLTTTFPAEAAPRAIASSRQMLLRPLPQRRLETNRHDRPTTIGKKPGKLQEAHNQSLMVTIMSVGHGRLLSYTID